MIDWQITKYETGYSEKYFNKNLKSHKKVYRICDRCNKKSWVEFRDSYKLCKSCSLSGRSLTKVHKQNISKGVNKNNLKIKHLHSITIDGITISTRLTYNLKTNHIGIGNTFNHQKEYNKQYQINYYKQSLYKNMPHSIRGSEEHRIRMSCAKQGINRNEWDGFLKKVNYERDHILSESKCTKLNERFSGSEMHHIMTGVVIYIPYELHRSISHNIKNQKNMKEINKLAFKYLINK